MDKIPFSGYDFFGYLSAGGVVLFSIAFALLGVEAFEFDVDAKQVLGVLVASYIAGHMVATFARFLLQNELTHRLLGKPTVRLFNADGKSDHQSGRKSFFADYYDPLPKDTAKRVLELSDKKKHDVKEDPESHFTNCFAAVQEQEYVRERLAVFLNLYGFARNVSMAALISALVLGVAAWVDDQKSNYALWAGVGVAVLVSVSLYYRYLKFYRLYSKEVYVAYANASPAEPAPLYSKEAYVAYTQVSPAKPAPPTP